MARIVRRLFALRCIGSDGGSHLVNVSREYMEVTPHDAGDTAAARDELILSCQGQPVVRIAKGHYRTTAGVELRSSEPDAP